MSRHSQAARRYAKAFFDLARERNLVDRAREDLDGLVRLLAGSPELSGFCGDYSFSMAARRRVLRGVFEGRLLLETWQLLQVIEERRRMGMLTEFCRAYGELHDQAKGLLKASLAVAFPLPEEDMRGIADRVSERTRRTVIMTTGTVPGLLGGFRLQVQDTVYDLSLVGALDAFRRRAGGSGG